MNLLAKFFIFASLLLCQILAKPMDCYYGPRGSLTVTCFNAVPTSFLSTDYRFSPDDKILKCVSCNLAKILSNTFDLCNNEIEILDISNSKIRTLEKESFVGLIHMTTLIMQNNFIELIVPETFQGVKRLEQLDVSNNSLKSLVNGSFQELKYLKKLNVSYNKIVNIESGAFIGLNALEELYLDHNFIENICGDFAPLANVQIMKFQHNKIKIDSFCFTSNPTLRDLDLSENDIKVLPPHAFKSLTHLERLNLSFNGIEVIDPDSFLNLYFLEVLSLKSNHIFDIHRKLFRGLHLLRDLDLSNNSISDFKTGYFSGMPELRHLNLSYNKIEYLEKTGILSLPNLGELDFKNNSIRDIDYKIIVSHLPRLTHMDITNNPLHCSIVPKIIKYFETDYITLLISNSSEPCTEKPLEEVDTTSEEAYETSVYVDMHRGDIVALYILVSIVLICIIALFYLQYRSYRLERNRNCANNYHDAPLICSSDLESRERGDY
ncbi:SLIT and NTRK-like protein 6 [Agrilus planipennis]|uniref:SLIT and NTRK-like protein 6 n=1 Tax=Agrilus planipennis TaxID=224129 RepID=A0A1W4XS66_AGRPL|nr:SLIT and NTRK-like protein 6 [Agrilus planipennis]